MRIYLFNSYIFFCIKKALNDFIEKSSKNYIWTKTILWSNCKRRGRNLLAVFAGKVCIYFYFNEFCDWFDLNFVFHKIIESDNWKSNNEFYGVNASEIKTYFLEHYGPGRPENLEWYSFCWLLPIKHAMWHYFYIHKYTF